jgi:hypothetical protein
VTPAAAAATPAVTPAAAAAPATPAAAATKPAAAAAATPAAAAAKPAAAAAKPAAAAAKPAAAAARTPAAASPPVTTSEVSLDLSEHLAVGKEDVQEAVRQSRVMSAVELPPELAEPPVPATPSKTPGRPVPTERPAARPSQPPVEAKQPERPVAVEAKQPERPVAVEVKPPEPPVEVKPPERPIEVKQPERPIEVKQPERPVEVKAPIEVKQPKVPEKQPVPPPEPRRGMSPAVIAVLIIVILGIAGFIVWQFVLNKPSQPGVPVGEAPVTPQPPPEQPAAPPQPPSVTTKVEVAAGAPKTILALFAGTIEWIEATDKDVKSNDVIVKLAGYRPLEAQVAALKKEADKLQADMNAAFQARDAASEADEAAMKKLQAKAEAAEKAYNAKADQLQKKTDELEQRYVRLTFDGKLTTLRKVGDKLPENTPVATVQPPPVPSATFKIPPGMKFDVGLTTAVRLGEKLLTCEIAESEEEKLRIICPQEPTFVEGATVSWYLP